MNRTLLNNKRYFISIIFVISILYFATSIVPVVHAQGEDELFQEDQINNSNVIDENIFQILKKLRTIYSSEYCIINDVFDKNFLSNPRYNIKQSYYLLNCILNDIVYENINECKVLAEKYQTYDFSFRDKNPPFNHTKYFSNYEYNAKLENTISSDFNEFWDLYVNATNYFSGNLAFGNHRIYERIINSLESWQADNYNTWLKNVNTGVEALWADFYVGLIISLILSVISFSSNVGVVSPVIWVICSFHAVKCAAGMGYLINGIQNFKKVQNHEVNIILVIKGNESEGIDHLHENFGIKAWNVNAYEKCDMSSGAGFEKEKFTYYLGEIEGKDSEKGYYALSSRDEPKYEKAPCPPGNWAIRINGNDEYKGKTIEIFNVPSTETVIHNVILEKRN